MSMFGAYWVWSTSQLTIIGKDKHSSLLCGSVTEVEKSQQWNIEVPMLLNLFSS